MDSNDTGEDRRIPLPASKSYPFPFPEHREDLSPGDSALLRDLLAHLRQCGVIATPVAEGWNKNPQEVVDAFIDEAAAAAQPEEVFRPSSVDEDLTRRLALMNFDGSAGNPLLWGDDEPSSRFDK